MGLAVIKGLDGIRFICALWVVIGHFGYPRLPLDKGNTLGLIAHGIFNNLISGPAAVIVFFVISGFFIHRPYADKQIIPDVWAYFARRYLRILVPLAAAIAISLTLVPVNLTVFDNSILWSLVAELIYYTIYPALLVVRRGIGSWLPLIALSFIAALCLAASQPTAGNYPSFGPHLNWVLGLPCWLMGCWLADFTLRHRTTSEVKSVHGLARHVFKPNIWIVRFGVLGLSMASSMARFHTPIGYPWTLNFFAIFATVWLLREVYHFQKIEAVAPLEWAGSWSYSLYLFHVIAITFLMQFNFPPFGSWTDWPLRMLFILAASYIFAVIFEFPAHSAARKLSASIVSKRQIA